MVDRLTPKQRQLNMSRIRSKDTAPEWTVRRLLHRRGFRYRLHRRDLPGNPDIVLPRYRTALLVNGCFWHGHSCPRFRLPSTRPNFWLAKIDSNRRRDAVALTALHAQGWRTLRVWECALKGRGRLGIDTLASMITGFITGDLPDCEIVGTMTENTAR
jgi:DNA mismatch endonuclease (patch repair protein)